MGFSGGTGAFIAGDTCATPCPGVPANDDCANAEPVTGVPEASPCTTDGDCTVGTCDTSRGICRLRIEADNICATDDRDG